MKEKLNLLARASGKILNEFFNNKSKSQEKFLNKIMKKEKRSEKDFNDTLYLINKYKAVEATFKKAEYFVNVSYDSLAIFPDNEDKKIFLTF